MFSKATSFNSDLSVWDVSKGRSFVSCCWFLFCFPFLYVSHIFYYYISIIFFVVYSNQYIYWQECFLKQLHSTLILVFGRKESSVCKRRRLGGGGGRLGLLSFCNWHGHCISYITFSFFFPSFIHCWLEGNSPRIMLWFGYSKWSVQTICTWIVFL